MSPFTFRSWLAAACIALAAVLPATAQTNAPSTNAPSTNAPPAKVIPPIAVGDVVTEAQSASTKLKAIQTSTAPDTVAQQAREDLELAKQAVDKRQESDAKFQQTTPTLDTLQSSQAAWQAISTSLNEIQKRLGDQVKIQTTSLNDLTAMAQTWGATLASTQAAKAPTTTVQSIQATQALIDATTLAVNTDLKELYVLQRAVAAQSDRVTTGLDSLSRAMAKAQAALRQQDQPQLWNPDAFSGPGVGVMTRESDTVSQQLAGLRAYLGVKIGTVLIQAILLAMLIATFCWIRKVVCERAKTSPTCMTPSGFSARRTARRCWWCS